MTKNKAIIILLLTLIVGISFSWPTIFVKIYDFNNNEMLKQMEQFSIKSKAPNKVPFEDMHLWDVKIDNNKQQGIFSLMNRHKDTLDIRITKKTITYLEPLNSKEVNIGKDIRGTFIANDSGKRILMWQDSDIFYKITYYSKLTPMEVSQKQLISMANSFQ